MPYRILSLYFGHDANICLLEDGHPLLVLEKERVTRVKHDQGQMEDIVREYLRRYNWGLNSIDLMVINPLCRPTLEGIGYSWEVKGDTYEQFPSYEKPQWIGPPEVRYSMHKIKFLDRIYDGIAVDHHLAHVAGALFTSPFQESGVLSADGGGDNRYCALGYGIGNKIEFMEYDWGRGRAENYSRLNIGSTWNSIGYFNFGFKSLEGAGKLMGLSSYASATDLLKEYITRHALFYWGSAFPSYLFDRQTHLDPMDPFSQQLAASLQEFTEDMFLLAAKRMKERKKVDNLCLTGGCAMNCLANSKVHLSGLFKDTFVPAQPHDGGLALGQALFAWHHVLENPRAPKTLTPFLGTNIGDISTDRIDDVLQALLNQKTVGIAFGKAESGPRALGHRSILADPRQLDIKEHLNNHVKHREWFRPYAPMIPIEDFEEWFEFFVPSRYMSYAATVKPDKRHMIPGVVHVDGTARPQIVSKEENRFFHKLLNRWKERTGVPILLNTSFNCQEPLVDTEEQAVNTWKRSGLDVLVTPKGVFQDKNYPEKSNPVSPTTQTASARTSAY